MSSASEHPDVAPEYGTPTKPVQRDLIEARGIIHAWLEPRLDGAADLELSEITMPSGAGVANETLMFDAAWRQGNERRQASYVLRADSPTSLFLDSPLVLHHDLYRVIGERTTVPVPPVFGYEPDSSLLGVPFFVMGKVDGRVPSDQPPYNVEGWVKDLQPQQRATMWRNFVELMVSMNQLDVDLFPMLDRPVEGSSGLEQDVRRWIRYVPWTLGDEPPHPVIAATMTWLVDHLPSDAPTGFAWGDARYQNVIFQDEQVAAALDWDMVSLAGGESDLAWFCVLNHNQTVSMAVPELDGFGTRLQTVERWEALMGRPVRHWEYQLVFAAYRLAVVLVRLPKLLAAAGLREAADAVANNNAGIPYLAQMLDLPWDGPLLFPWTGLEG
jgi:aminoglycoside phosphotransferase (APT) family kinase protein